MDNHLSGPEQQKQIQHLTTTVRELNGLCNDLDPYLPIPDDMKIMLKNYGIEDFYDPFDITNQLLLLLENSIEELRRLETDITQ